MEGKSHPDATTQHIFKTQTALKKNEQLADTQQKSVQSSLTSKKIYSFQIRPHGLKILLWLVIRALK